MSEPEQFRVPEDYFWPGTQVLRNYLRIRDQPELERAERLLTAGRIAELRLRPVQGHFDLPHLQAIHRRVFGDVYPWAGQLRAVTLSKGGSLFCQPQFLNSAAEDVFTGLHRRDLLRGLDRDGFTTAAAELWGDVNALHPFRDGNGRTQRVFLADLGEQAGHPLVWPPGQGQANIVASKGAMVGDTTGLQRLIAAAAADSSVPLDP